MVQNMYEHSLDLEPITGQGTGQRILFPRIYLTPSADSTLFFSFTRRQFQKRKEFSTITINKTQATGPNILDKVGLYLPQLVLSHGLMVNYMLPCPQS